jgi:uncharacterized membrane protein
LPPGAAAAMSRTGFAGYGSCAAAAVTSAANVMNKLSFFINRPDENVSLAGEVARLHIASMSSIRNGGAAAKTVSFAAVHFTVAFSIAYLLTGSIGIASALAVVEPLANTVAYYFHEKLWQRVSDAKVAMPKAPVGVQG